MKYTCTPLLLALLLTPFSLAFSDIPYPGMTPGKAREEQKDASLTLSNDILKAAYECKNGILSFGGLKTQRGMEVLPGGELFILETENGKRISSSSLKAEKVSLISLKADKKAFRFSDRRPGKALTARFSALDGALNLEWRAVLRNGSHYLRQEIRITSRKPVPMKEIVGMSYNLDPTLNPSPAPSGKSRGSLLATEHLFAALETPMGINTADKKTNSVRGTWSRKTELNPGEVWEISSVVGLLTPGQSTMVSKYLNLS